MKEPEQSGLPDKNEFFRHYGDHESEPKDPEFRVHKIRRTRQDDIKDLLKRLLTNDTKCIDELRKEAAIEAHNRANMKIFDRVCDYLDKIEAHPTKKHFRTTYCKMIKSIFNL